MLRRFFLRTQKAIESQNDGGYKLPPNLCVTEIWLVPAIRRSSPGTGPVVDPATRLRPGPYVMLRMKPEHKVPVSPTGKHFDESVCC